MKDYADKPFIISTGYAGVLNIETISEMRHKLIDAYHFDFFEMNSSKLDLDMIMSSLIITHKLNLKN